MGSPLGPTLANIFLSINETEWLNQCPNSFKPSFYNRYVDDTFAVFTDRAQAHSFLDYLNSKHPNINFIIEKQVSNTISFLDMNVSIQNNTI